MKFTAQLLIAVLICFPHVFAADKSSSLTIRQVEDVQWGYLNPLRGDKSPGAAELWGDRTKDVATGMLVRFKPGFSSPAHIHNVTYRGLVIEGLLHNDDPKAAKVWMPPSSFWTQPAGDNHITAAAGDKNLIFLEIDRGPYLVKPSNAQFDSRETAINVHASNLVWLSGNELTFIDNDKVEIAMLWGGTNYGEVGGALVKFPAGFNGKIDVEATEFRAVVIKGGVVRTDSGQLHNLSAGSYFGSTGQFEHKVTSVKEVLIYFRTDGVYRIY
ncbi:DUF4437 domain-containing protein [Maricurvus nonylphenolicus]|uniref:DUF4437 domain-containing protein n=1 Tax=Maricurvus nonylphenolicus TaxID=1008307 RepID=UPI0036F1BDA7